MSVAAFPYDRLPAVPRVAVSPLRCAARLSAAAQGWRTGLVALESTIRTPIRCAVRDVTFHAARSELALAAELVVLRVELPESIAMLELDPGLALGLSEAALGVDGGASSPAFRPLTDPELGVLAYLAASFLVSSQTQGARLLGWSVDSRALALLLREQDHIAVRLWCELGTSAARYAARLWLPAASYQEPAPDVPLAAFASHPVELRVEAGGATLSSRELVELAPGDVVLLDQAHARPQGGSLVGSVWLRPALARAGRFRCTLLDERTLKVEESRDWEVVPMASSNEPSERGVLGALAHEVPVELRVEIGRATLALSAVAGLSPGEILVLERAPGDPVDLAVGDRLVGRGQLVLVDGQVGVRVTDISR